MHKEHLIEDLQEAAPILRDFVGDDKPICGLILGSGLNCFADILEESRVLNFSDVPHMNSSTCVGHVGRFVLGTVPGTDQTVLCMQGRLHGYEGNSARMVAFPVWLMHEVGISILATTNAAGAINTKFKVGDFCLMSDHINLTGRNPIAGIQPDQIANRFVPMLDAYDRQMREMMLESAKEVGVFVDEGVYLGLLGPSFETPAEIRAFRIMGADTVAMSVVEEVIAARHVGMRVLGMSLISNMACGVEGGDPQLDDIYQITHVAENQFPALMTSFIKRLHASLV